jgi:hypothetical protein
LQQRTAIFTVGSKEQHSLRLAAKNSTLYGWQQRTPLFTVGSKEQHSLRLAANNTTLYGWQQRSTDVFQNTVRAEGNYSIV